MDQWSGAILAGNTLVTCQMGVDQPPEGTTPLISVPIDKAIQVTTELHPIVTTTCITSIVPLVAQRNKGSVIFVSHNAYTGHLFLLCLLTIPSRKVKWIQTYHWWEFCIWSVPTLKGVHLFKVITIYMRWRPQLSVPLLLSCFAPGNVVLHVIEWRDRRQLITATNPL